MFILTAKLPKRRILLLLPLLLALLLLPLLLHGAPSDDAPTLRAADNDARLAYLASLGWEVQPQPLETLAVVLPAQLAEPYLSYNTLQLAQGFDLTPYCGRTLERYTYAVTNHPTAASCQADLYVCDDTIVAGDVICTGENGFLAGLAYPKAS